MEKSNTKKNRHIFFWIIVSLTSLCYFAILELSKNTIVGWALAGAVIVGLIVCELKLLKSKKKLVHLGLWAALVVAFALIGLVSAPPFKRVPAVDVKQPEKTQIVQTAYGDVQGVCNADKSVEVFAGIPYAKPPVGELRWKAPQEPEKWSGVLACDHFAPMSMQSRDSELMNSLTQIVGYNNYKISLSDNYREAVSEDSLYLNVFKPAGDISDAPVLVFIHGGSLTTGQSSFSEYRGEDLAKQGIVFVSITYRLGVFGYYANEQLQAESPEGTTGNYGLLDQIQALRWVQKNIAAFGGDPQKVTIAGESAGASSVNALCVSPLAKGLFRYAIAESSGITAKKPFHTFRSFEEAKQTGSDIMKEFSCESIEQLREIPAEKLVKTQHENSAMTVDGYAIAEQPYLTYEKGNNNESALLNGFNAHEADVFNFMQKVEQEDYAKALQKLFPAGNAADEVLKQFPYDSKEQEYALAVDMGGEAKGTYNYILSGAWFAYSHYRWSEYLAGQEKPVYLYCFTKNNRSLRAYHGGEMPYAYGNLWRHAWLYDESDTALSETMQHYWVNFVKTGNPNGEGLPAWEQYSRGKVLELGENVAMVQDMYNDLYPMIDDYQNAVE